MKGRYYLAKVTSRWDPVAKKVRKVYQGHLGTVTSEGVVPRRSVRRPVDAKVYSKEFGATWAVSKLTEDIRGKLGKHFPGDADWIYVTALIRCVRHCAMLYTEHLYGVSYLSERFPGLNLSSLNLSRLMAGLGFRRAQMVAFMREFIPDKDVYRFRGTRAATVPAEVFGEGRHTGVLGVDRYAAYNNSWNGKIQYCLEHMRRNLDDLLAERPDDVDRAAFIPRLLELFRDAMTLRNRKRGRKAEYDAESRRIRDEILAIAATPVKDKKLAEYFGLISKRRDRFFQWVCHPEIPAENNLAERRLRPLVTARKVSFGSQSEKGLATRETLMAIVDTLSLRYDDPVARLAEALDAIAQNPMANVAKALWR